MINFYMKIFLKNQKKNLKPATLQDKIVVSKGAATKERSLPSFSKEWKNTVYSYNKNSIKNLPIEEKTINRILQNYFNLYLSKEKDRVSVSKRRNTSSKIFISNAELQHTNNKAKVTFYVINRERDIYKKKFLKMNRRFNKKFIQRYRLLYKRRIGKIFHLFKKYQNKYIFAGHNVINKQKFIKYKLNYLNNFLHLKNIWFKKTSTYIVRTFANKYKKKLQEYELNYSLNQYKFHQQMLLPKLSNIIKNILGKKIEYNIVNLKSFSYNSDLFTTIIGSKIRKRKNLSLARDMSYALGRAYIPRTNTVVERTRLKKGSEQIKDLRFVSATRFATTNSSKIHQILYNSIDYKILRGIRIELKGRLTKRYRADRSVYRFRSKGSLRNVYSSYQGLSSTLHRGNSPSNVNSSLFASKRRIGAFAVKGWISGK